MKKNIGTEGSVDIGKVYFRISVYLIYSCYTICPYSLINDLKKKNFTKVSYP